MGHEPFKAVCSLEHNFLLLFYRLKWIQDLGVDNSGRPQLMSAPLDKLKDDFPLRPRLMGGLLPQTVNLWMGYSSMKGSSSGLHHDFHDNLYVLLRGKKTFRCILKTCLYIICSIIAAFALALMFFPNPGTIKTGFKARE